MPIAIQGAIGIQNNSDTGDPKTVRMGKQGDLIASELHGRYYEQAYRKNLFVAATQAGQTTTVGLATTYTGLVVSNPITSSVNLVMLKASMFQSVLQATQVEAYGIATGYNATTNVTHTTPQAVRNCFINGPSGIGVADTSATLPTAPFYTLFVTNTATATQNSPGALVDFEGTIVLPPGGFICWVTPAQASVASAPWFSFKWEEVPV